MTDIIIEMAGLKIQYHLLHKSTYSYFAPYIMEDDWNKKTVRTISREKEAKQEAGISADLEIGLTEEQFQSCKKIMKENCPDAYVESCGLISETSRHLLTKNRCIFHGVSFIWRDFAWIITAPSGVGKTTQLRHWQNLYGDEIQLINGDKPVLEVCQDGVVMVHPSPWNGKENYRGSRSAKLAGIICLEQATENIIRPISSQEALLPIYEQFLYYAENEDEIKGTVSIEDKMLRQAQVWKLLNRGDIESASMTHHAMEEFWNEHGKV